MNEMYYDVCESTWLIVRHHTNLRQCHSLAIYVGKIEKLHILHYLELLFNFYI